MRRQGWLIACAIAGICGCGEDPPAPYPVWSRPSEGTTLSDKSEGGFPLLVRAAKLAEVAAPNMLERVHFTPLQKSTVIRDLGPAIQMLSKSANMNVRFEFAACAPFIPLPYHSGWRLLSRSLVWQIDAIRENDQATPADLDKAVNLAILGTKFGFDLSGGGAADAGLGMGIVDEIRIATVPLIPRFGAAQLKKLSQKLSSIFRNRPEFAEMVRHEKLQMLARVQAVQDAYISDDYDALKLQLGDDAREAISYLKQMKKSDRERPEFFKSFAEEADEEVQLVLERIKLPASKREKYPDRRTAFRPWKRLSKHFFQTCRPLVDWQDRTCARTRLFILEAMVMQEVKVRRLAPKILSSIPIDLRLDPYTGASLRYAASGQEYRIYSVGANAIDDGGETDDAWQAPDLLLESK